MKTAFPLGNPEHELKPWRARAIRIAIPVIAIVSLFLVVVNEVDYQTAMGSIRRNIGYVDARFAASRVLQLLTDAETGQRGYLLTENKDYLEPLVGAVRDLPTSRSLFSDYLMQENRGEHKDRIEAAIDRKVAELNRTLSLHSTGERQAALALVNSNAGKQEMDNIRQLVGAEIQRMESLQLIGRKSIIHVQERNRIAIALLAITIATSMFFLSRQLTALNRYRDSHEKQLQDSVRERTRKIARILKYLSAATEKEKDRLARVLHDQLGALLTAIVLELARIRSLASEDAQLKERMAERMEKTKEFLTRAVDLKRQIIEELRPSTLSTIGLSTALTVLCAETSRRTGIPIHPTLQDLKLPVDSAIVLFRVAQNTLSSLCFPATTHVLVALSLEQQGAKLEVTCAVSGYDGKVPDDTHLGSQFLIENLEGDFAVTYQTGGGGFTVTARLPAAISSMPA